MNYNPNKPTPKTIIDHFLLYPNTRKKIIPGDMAIKIPNIISDHN